MTPIADTGTRIAAMATTALELFIDAVERIPGHNWDQPSNLEQWTVRRLVGHVTGSATKTVVLVEGGELWGRSEPADWACAAPAARLRELATRLCDALPNADMQASRESPEGEVALHRALAYPVSDLALHSWDLHRSLGGWIELPGDLLDFCTDLVNSVPENMLRRPGGFGPAQPTPTDATPTTRLLTYLGRSA